MKSMKLILENFNQSMGNLLSEEIDPEEFADELANPGGMVKGLKDDKNLRMYYDAVMGYMQKKGIQGDPNIEALNNHPSLKTGEWVIPNIENLNRDYENELRKYITFY